MTRRSATPRRPATPRRGAAGRAARALRSATLAAAALCLAQTTQAQPDALRAVERWRFTFSFSENGSYSSENAEWTQNVEATGSAVLRRDPRDPSRIWTGTPEISVHFRFSGVIGLADPNGCTTRVEIDDTVTPLELEDSAELIFFRDGYQISLGSTSATVRRRVTRRCDNLPEEVVDNVSGKSWGPIVVETFDYPTSGTALEGTYRSDDGVDPEEPTIEELARIPGTLTFRLVPDEVEELELEIDDTGAYETWRPSARRDGSAGTPLVVRAKVVTASGASPSIEARRWNWRLVGTSREPGIAMNYPVDASDDDPDLRFDVDEGELVTLGEDAQTLERYVTGGVEDSVRIAPHDWGGWSTLEVTVTLEGGRTLEGRAKVAGTDGLRLPKRAEGSFIADEWKRGRRLPADDAADDESDPPGDGTDGDGLSLYQEYRGFYEDTRFVTGDPKKKDLFVHAFEAAAGGVALFEYHTKLQVRGRLLASELPQSRVINANRRAGPGSTTQHALRVRMQRDVTAIVEGTTTRVTGLAVGGPGNPKRISDILIASDWALLSARGMEHIVAHELLHGVNVWHHGQGDTGLVTWALDRDGELAETSRRGESKFRAYAEPGDTDTTDFWVLWLMRRPAGGGPWRQYVGDENGTHSGNDGCVMRYFAATAYVGRPDVTRRYLVTEEPAAGICRSAPGTGVNGERMPQSRYGDAASGRGNCRGQLLVNDAVDPPPR